MLLDPASRTLLIHLATLGGPSSLPALAQILAAPIGPMGGIPAFGVFSETENAWGLRVSLASASIAG